MTAGPGERRGRLYDVSPPLAPGMAAWPGDPAFEKAWAAAIARGDGTNVGRLSLSTHAGAHADAPLHLRDGAADSASQPLGPFWGTARVFSLEGVGAIETTHLDRLSWRGVERALFRTRRPGQAMRFDDTMAHFTAEAARALAARGLLLVGLDTPSVDSFTSQDLPAHRALFEAGVSTLECLELGGVPEGDYELVALPLRLVGGDASPVRAVLRALG